MTTASLPAAAQIPRPAVSGPARKQALPGRQRISTVVLVVGTVLSLGSLFGPDWALRVGVVIALLSAIASCALAWRELYLTKRKHAQDLLAVGRRHTEDLRTERQHNADVLDTVSGRAQRWRQEVERQQTQIAGLRVETGALRSDLSSVRRQLVRADGVITKLRENVRERDLEIALIRSDATGSEAEVHALPRRVQTDRAAGGAAAGGAAGGGAAGGGVAGGNDVRRVIDLHADEPALPNFEADRRRA